MLHFLKDFLLGDLPMLRQDPLGIYRASVAERPLTTFRIGRITNHLVGDPELVRHVLVQNQANYDKRTPTWINLSILIGNSLVVSNGLFWKRQRQFVARAFHGERIHKLRPVFLGVARDCAARWESAASSGQPLVLEDEMLHCTLLSVTRALFDADIDDPAFKKLSENISFLLRSLILRNSGFKWPLVIPTRANRALRAAIRPVDEFIDGIIARTRTSLQSNSSNSSGETDFLTKLMLARDEVTGEFMTDVELRDEVMGLLFAGHETTIVALTWFWVLLQRHPEVLARIRRELESVLGSRSPEEADLAKLSTLRGAMLETLRLYPPVWIFDRRALRADQLGQLGVRKGDIVIICPYGMQRNEAFWKDPDKFNPSRFEPGWEQSVNRYTFMPFGAGPRACLGMSFAMIEIQLLMAYLIPRFTMDIHEVDDIRPVPKMTIRPDRQIRMTVRRTDVPL